MASKTVVELVDDLDGSLANETVSFAHDGVEYAIDLSEENAARLRSVLAEFIGPARRVTGRTRRAAVAESSPPVSAPVSAAVRAAVDAPVKDTRAEVALREAARRERSSAESRRGNGARVGSRGNGSRGGDVAAAELTAEIRRLASKTAQAVSAAQPTIVEADALGGSVPPDAAPTLAVTAPPREHFSASTQDSTNLTDQTDAEQAKGASDVGKATALLIPFQEAGL